MLPIQMYFETFKRFKMVRHFPLVIGEDFSHYIPIDRDGDNIKKIFILKIEKDLYEVHIEKELSKDKFSPHKVPDGGIIHILGGENQYYLLISDDEVVILRNKS